MENDDGTWDYKFRYACYDLGGNSTKYQMTVAAYDIDSAERQARSYCLRNGYEFIAMVNEVATANQ